MLYHKKRCGVEILSALIVLLLEVASARIFMSFNAGLDKGSKQAGWTLTRDVILSLRPAAIKLDLQTSRRIRSLGCAGRSRGCRGGRLKAQPTQQSGIPVVTARRSATTRYRPAANYLPTDRPRVLAAIRCIQYQQPRAVDQHDRPAAPTLYVLNAAALTKPHAVDHLATDLKSTGASIAVITKTHLKQMHADNVIGIDGYSMF